MPGLTCNACNKEFFDDAEQKLHYKSDWHRYNLKRKHLKSRIHIQRASQGTNHPEEEKAIVKPLPRRAVNRPPPPRYRNDDESEDEWMEVDQEEDLVAQATNSLTDLNVNEQATGDDMDTDNDKEEELDPCCCFMCDLDHDTIKSCMIHMHQFHGFFIPDVEYLNDPEGLLTYLGLKVKRDFMCLYCNERCHPFTSLEAVRKHMQQLCG
ncbi:hypothetical protein REPUB_Repub05bG0121400 [Reevesia pubescens]